MVVVYEIPGNESIHGCKKLVQVTVSSLYCRVKIEHVR
jgi:hypothetical protein